MELLRFASQVDGLGLGEDDHGSAIGKFLQDVHRRIAAVRKRVGRANEHYGPSFSSENEFCPAWRDARLSVRPGITGMWQVCRTRSESMDFQEWIYYDTEYVRRLSFGTDLWVCLQTARKLISQFLDQFG